MPPDKSPDPVLLLRLRNELDAARTSVGAIDDESADHVVSHLEAWKDHIEALDPNKTPLEPRHVDDALRTLGNLRSAAQDFNAARFRTAWKPLTDDLTMSLCCALPGNPLIKERPYGGLPGAPLIGDPLVKETPDSASARENVKGEDRESEP